MAGLVLYLLTHSRELSKKTNTGALVLQALADSGHLRVELIEWQRKSPDPLLVDLSATQQLGLVYPLSADTGQACYLLQQGQYQAQNPVAVTEMPIRLNEAVKHWVLLDATWQEAAKMLRQSPYLHSCYRLGIKPATPSLYALRRNQRDGALCTAEVVMELLQQTGFIKEKEQLMLLFEEFNKR